MQNASTIVLEIYLKKPVFETGDSNLIIVLPTITKQYIKRVHTSTKLTPVQASLKKNESFVYQNLLDKRKKVKPKFQVNDLGRTADLKKTFSKSDLTKWSYKLYKKLLKQLMILFRVIVWPF